VDAPPDDSFPLPLPRPALPPRPDPPDRDGMLLACSVTGALPLLLVLQLCGKGLSLRRCTAKLHLGRYSSQLHSSSGKSSGLSPIEEQSASKEDILSLGNVDPPNPRDSLSCQDVGWPDSFASDLPWIDAAKRSTLKDGEPPQSITGGGASTSREKVHHFFAEGGRPFREDFTRLAGVFNEQKMSL